MLSYHKYDFLEGEKAFYFIPSSFECFLRIIFTGEAFLAIIKINVFGRGTADPSISMVFFPLDYKRIFSTIPLGKKPNV